MSYMVHQATMPNATTSCKSWVVINSMYVDVKFIHGHRRKSGRYHLILDRDKQGMIDKIMDITNDALSYPEFVICVAGNKVSCLLSKDEKQRRYEIENCLKTVEKAYEEIILPSPLPPNKLIVVADAAPCMTYKTEKGMNVSFTVLGERFFTAPIPLAIGREEMFQVILEAVTLFTLNKKSCNLTCTGVFEHIPKPESFSIHFRGDLHDKAGNDASIRLFVEQVERLFGTFKF